MFLFYESLNTHILFCTTPAPPLSLFLNYELVKKNLFFPGSACGIFNAFRQLNVISVHEVPSFCTFIYITFDKRVLYTAVGLRWQQMVSQRVVEVVIFILKSTVKEQFFPAINGSGLTSPKATSHHSPTLTWKVFVKNTLLEFELMRGLLKVLILVVSVDSFSGDHHIQYTLN